MQNYLATEEYVDFLKKNCGVRGFDFEERSKDCARADVDVILRYLTLLDLRPGDKLLEIGCGVGRIIKEIYDTYGLKTFGIDRTPAIIAAARERVAPIASDLRVATAEETTHEDNFFDKVLCWGVFDLTTQELSLAEMCRVTKPGGLILITGKNDNYHDDDRDGCLAEVDYREKGIPNHFTDFSAFMTLATELGLKEIGARFFQRRGDFMNDVVDHEQPERFYEYLVIFNKAATKERISQKLPQIGSLISKTCSRISATDATI